MTPAVSLSSPFTASNMASAQQTQRHGRAHSVLQQGNTATDQPNGVGAVQSFASILSGITSSVTKQD